MAVGVTRQSRMAVVAEDTAGTLKAPVSGSDYIAILNDFSVTPNIEKIESDEIAASIGARAPILGLESPEVSLSKYLANSGVVAQAPESSDLLKAAFGATTAAPTETTSTTGTSTTQITVSSATGLEAGQALLIKDGTNGYRIRPIHSISGANAALSFSIPNAPANGTLLGRPVLFKAADTGHSSLSVWDYRGNGTAVQAVAGARVSEMTMTAEAGQPISMSFALNGSAFYFNPITITSSTDSLDFVDDDGANSLSITAKVYKNPHDAAQALEDAFNAASTDTFTVTYNDRGANLGKFTVASNGTTFEADWLTSTDSLGAAFGFTADDSGATSYNSDSAITLTSSHTPSLDAQDPIIAKNLEVLFGDQDDGSICFEASSVNFTLSNGIQDVLQICKETAVAEKIVQSRACSVAIQANLQQYDVDAFNRYINGTAARFAFNFGVKEGGNWVAGKCGSLYLKQCKVSEFETVDADGVIAVSLTLDGYVTGSDPEVFLSFV